MNPSDSMAEAKSPEFDRGAGSARRVAPSWRRCTGRELAKGESGKRDRANHGVQVLEGLEERADVAVKGDLN